MRALIDLLFGKPLASSEDRGQKIGVAAGIPMFGLDGLGSAAYGPEAALTILLPLGAAGAVYALPIAICVVALLGIVYFSYRQTIAAYPNGGGSYPVAHENPGPRAGILAAAALMIDYILNVAVGISAGVGALVSAAPSLHSHRLGLCLGILALLTLVNLRGTREKNWQAMAVDSAVRRGVAPPRLVILKSPYRYVLTPILEFALEQQSANPGRKSCGGGVRTH